MFGVQRLVLLLISGFLCGVVFNFTSLGQPSVSLNLTAHIDSIIAGMPTGAGTDEYQSPTAPQQTEWRSMMDLLLGGDLLQAGTKASALGYRLIRYTDTGTVPSRDYLVIEREPTGINHWGTFVFALSPSRPRLVIQSPHPRYDSKTGAQGWYVFSTVGARAFFLSGTHRCNSSLFSPCDGTTTSCSDDYTAHRRSDQPHVVDGTFQITTAAVLAAVDSCVFIQPHGFSKLSTDPDIIMSNGTRKAPPAEQDHLARLRDNLLAVDPALTFKLAHIDITWTRLIATTNTQGRLINGSPSPCNTEATSATGRFLHLEQKYAGLRDTKTNWGKLAQAVALTFPETPTSVEGTTPATFVLEQNYPNPFNPSTTIRYSLGPSTGAFVGGDAMSGTSATAGSTEGSQKTIGGSASSHHVRLAVYDVLGREVAVLVNGLGSTGTFTERWNAAGVPSGVYFYRLNAGSHVATRTMLLLR